MTEQPVVKRECQSCGNKYIPTGRTQKYCNSRCSTKKYKTTTKGNSKKINPKFLTRGTIHYNGLLLDKDK